MIINREHMIEKQDIKFLSKIVFRKKCSLKSYFCLPLLLWAFQLTLTNGLFHLKLETFNLKVNLKNYCSVNNKVSDMNTLVDSL